MIDMQTYYPDDPMPLNPLWEKWKEKYPNTKLINMYGITETTVHVTFKELSLKDLQLNNSNIGRPIPTLKVLLLDKKRIFDGYSCIFCGDCPSGDYWKCPEEDRAVYDEYMERRKAWEERHPDYMNVLMSQEIEIEIAVKGEGL